jgi:hypothetical protein
MIKFDLLLPFRTLDLGKGVDDGLTENLLAWPDCGRLSEKAGEVVGKDGQCALVHRPQHEASVENEDTGRQVGQNRFQISSCRFQLGAVTLVVASCLVQLAGHLFERARQDAQFITAIDRLARSVVASRHGLGTFCKDRQGCRQTTGQHESQRDGGEQGQQYGQRESHRVDAGKPFATQREFLIVSIHGLDAVGVQRERSRYRLGELQDARLDPEARWATATRTRS